MADANTVSIETTSEETAKTTDESGAVNTETSAGKTEGAENKTFTQADLDRIVKERLKKADEAAVKKADEVRAEAERKAAEEQGQFKPLYETAQATAQEKAAELETATAKLNRLNEILGGDVNKRIEKWPDEVKKLIPSGEGVDALARFERVSELAPLAERLMNVTARPGNGAGPTPSGGPANNTVDGPRPQNYRI